MCTTEHEEEAGMSHDEIFGTPEEIEASVVEEAKRLKLAFMGYDSGDVRADSMNEVLDTLFLESLREVDFT